MYKSQNRLAALAFIAFAVAILASAQALAQNNFGNRSSVGGVAIDAKGVVSQPTITNMKVRRDAELKAFQKVPTDLGKAAEIRMVSLSQLEKALAEAKEAADLPDSIRYMGGLQRIEYVFLYPEKNDIVLAGPGEGWKIDAEGDVVGITTGRPVLRLEDFLVAMQTVDAARNGGITCSIDPTTEGRRNFEAFMGRQRKMSRAVELGAAKALGMQKITLTGVPETTRFARILVAADYRMKRIAMKLEPSPVRGMVSYVDMLRSAPKNAMPRWWMACNYQPLERSEDGLAWRLKGQGVKTMTEDELIAADGTITGTGRANPIAQKWSDMMTEKYDELADKDSVFGDLRNIMDMCVVAALIRSRDLTAVANCELPILSGKQKTNLVDNEWNAPKTVATQCSFVKKGRNWIITASGGVDISSWQVASKDVVNKDVSAVRAKAVPADKLIW